MKTKQINADCIIFNTRRLYTSEGQVVVACFATNEDGTTDRSVVYFNDVSRMVNGTIRDFKGNLDAHSVMNYYDHGDYECYIGFELRDALEALYDANKADVQIG